MALLKEGQKAPDFSAKNQEGKEVSLHDFKGQKVVLYFYPKDNTPGCTAEACSLRDSFDDFKSKGYTILGVSPDSEKSHTTFRSKYDLPFDLISDPDHKILEAYGAWGEKKMYGKSYEGVLRTTYLIDEEGIIEQVIQKVNTKEHAGQIFQLIEA